ncbi:MAG: TolC family protein [Acidobacteriota bacterium]
MLALASAGAWAETVRLDADAAAVRIVEVSYLAAANAARAERADAGVAAADAAKLPSISASASLGQRSSAPEFRLPLTLPGSEPLVLFPDITTTYSAAVQVRQDLFTGGAITATRTASRRERDEVEAARLQVRAELQLAARLGYWEAVRAAAAGEVATAREERALRLLADTRALADAGMALRADLLAAEERLATARVGVLRAASAATQSLSQLRSLLHLPAGGAIELADTLAGALPPAPEELTVLQELALQRRPELTALAAHAGALKAREELARAPSRPALGALAQWDLARPNQRYFPLADEWSDSWSVGLAASWTLFDGGKARAEVASSQAAQRALAAEHGEAARRIALEVEIGRIGQENALAVVAAADAARAAADERERAARERYNAGLATTVEILDAQAGLAEAEQAQIEARAGVWLAAARLAKAVGQ